MPLLPPWYGVLKMAKEWHIPAWDIDKTVPAVYWYIRFQYIENEKALATKWASEQRKR